MRTFYNEITQRRMKAWHAQASEKFPDLDWPFHSSPLRVRVRRGLKFQWLVLRETVGLWIYPYSMDDE